MLKISGEHFANSLPLLLDLLTIEPRTPAPEPVKYDKTDGQWYTHDGVDVKDTQKRKGIKWKCCYCVIYLIQLQLLSCSHVHV